MVSKVSELVSQAREYLARPGAENSEDCWHAYVCIEYAILSLKLTAGVEAPAALHKRKRLTPAQWLEEARTRLDGLKLDQEPAILLQSLRDCREPLKHLVSNYDRRGLRSTTS